MSDREDYDDFGITEKMIDFGLNCNLEDPSYDEEAGFYAGVNWAIYMINRVLKEREAAK